MIKKFRRRFIVIAMLSLFLVFGMVIASINAVLFSLMDSNANAILNLLSDYSGELPNISVAQGQQTEKFWQLEFELTAETRYDTRYFSVILYPDQAPQIDTRNVAAISRDKALHYAEQAIKSTKKSAYYDTYKYKIVENGGALQVYFVDCYRQKQIQGSFLRISAMVGLISMVLMFILLSFFSKQIMKPIVVNINRQKQFITDAGHEIKTPLAIISANADVLELTYGESKWIHSIHNQTERLTALVNQLLTLAQAQENKEKNLMSELDMSELVTEMADSFLALIQQNGKSLSSDIQKNLRIQGNRESLEELISILLDNAAKYAAEKSQIDLKLQQQGKKVVLSISNPSDGLTKEELPHLFDRFYRTDASRARETGGSGIGLAMAAAIVHEHQAKIDAKMDSSGKVSFVVVF